MFGLKTQNNLCARKMRHNLQSRNHSYCRHILTDSHKQWEPVLARRTTHAPKSSQHGNTGGRTPPGPQRWCSPRDRTLPRDQASDRNSREGGHRLAGMARPRHRSDCSTDTWYCQNKAQHTRAQWTLRKVYLTPRQCCRCRALIKEK